jgi:hypothetical protein
MSPDFPSVAKATAQLYPQSGGSRVDGVIRVDPFTLSRLLSLTGPVQVPGLPYPISAENAVPFLLRDQYALFSDNARRHDLLGAVGRATFDRFTSGRAARPNVIADALSPAVRGTNLAMWFRDAEAQRLVARLGADAALPPLRGDELGVVTQNGGSSKIDFYLRRTVDYTARIDPDTGAIHSRVKIALRNAAPVCGSASRRNLNSCAGVSLYVVGNGLGLPVGTNRSYVSVYSPFVLKRATLDDGPWQPVAERELGRNVYSQFVDIAAGETRTIELELEGVVGLGEGSYRFRYFSQVLAHPDAVQATVAVAGGARIGRTNARPPVVVTVGQRRRQAVAATVTGGPWEVEVALRR